jgi:hypothetical protein
MHQLGSLFSIQGFEGALPLVSAGLLAVILIASFRFRAIVFCQYLETMTGIQLKPKQVKSVYLERGRDGVRELFLDLLIREDLKDGPLAIPEKPLAPPVKEEQPAGH